MGWLIKCHEWVLTAIDPHKRKTWRSGVSEKHVYAMCVATQLEGGPLMLMMLMHLHVNQKLDENSTHLYIIYMLI